MSPWAIDAVGCSSKTSQGTDTEGYGEERSGERRLFSKNFLEGISLGGEKMVRARAKFLNILSVRHPPTT